MILRRFTKHLNEQNWFAVGLDVLVVIVGIFLGLQVTNWQASINEEQEARNYLNRLHDDLQLDLTNINNSELFWSQVTDYGKTAMDYLEGPNDKAREQWRYLLALFQASQIAPFEVTDITYREVQQAGQLSLLKNPQLRQALAEYYSFNDGIAALTILKANPPYRNYIRGKIPSDVANYIWTRCFHVAGMTMNNQQLKDCESPISDKRAAEILINIKADTKVMELLRSWQITMRAGIELLPREKEMVNSLLSMITNESA